MIASIVGDNRTCTCLCYDNNGCISNIRFTSRGSCPTVFSLLKSLPFVVSLSMVLKHCRVHSASSFWQNSPGMVNDHL